MLAAVRLNWRLWTILQSELLDPQCPVPGDIRSNVLSLANFIDKHSADFIAKPKLEKLGVLISINRELAAGLFTDPEAEAQRQGDPAVAANPSPSLPPPTMGGGDEQAAVKIST